MATDDTPEDTDIQDRSVPTVPLEGLWERLRTDDSTQVVDPNATSTALAGQFGFQEHKDELQASRVAHGSSCASAEGSLTYPPETGVESDSAPYRTDRMDFTPERQTSRELLDCLGRSSADPDAAGSLQLDSNATRPQGVNTDTQIPSFELGTTDSPDGGVPTERDPTLGPPRGEGPTIPGYRILGLLGRGGHGSGLPCPSSRSGPHCGAQGHSRRRPCERRASRQIPHRGPGSGPPAASQHRPDPPRSARPMVIST